MVTLASSLRMADAGASPGGYEGASVGESYVAAPGSCGGETLRWSRRQSSRGDIGFPGCSGHDGIPWESEAVQPRSGGVGLELPPIAAI